MRRYKSIPEWVEENMFKQPRKDDPVFKLDDSGTRTNLSLGLHNDHSYVCARGFLLTARLAVEHVRQGGFDGPFLAYPIVFNYRHHVELMLKRLVIRANYNGVLYYARLKHLSEMDLQRLSKTHSLQWLWDRVRPVVQALGNVPAEDIEGINAYIRKLNEIDPQSVDFRYTTDIHQMNSRLEAIQGRGDMLGIQNFAEAMERLANYLEGFDSYFDDCINGYHELLSESYDPVY